MVNQEGTFQSEGNAVRVTISTCYYVPSLTLHITATKVADRPIDNVHSLLSVVDPSLHDGNQLLLPSDEGLLSLLLSWAGKPLGGALQDEPFLSVTKG